MKRVLALAVALVAVVLVAGASGASSAPAPEGTTSSLGYAPGVVLVGFDEQASAADRSAARVAAGARSARPLSPLARGAERLELAAGAEVSQAIAALRRDPHVRYAEPDYRVEHVATADDGYYTNGSLWGMYSDLSSPKNAFGSHAADAWAAGWTGSSDVYVGIIDEGADFNHPDLAANFWVNPGESGTDSLGRSKATNGVDDDSSGYKDDVHGWDFYNKDGSTYDGTSDDHGTHVSGTIGARGGNNVGVAGVNWNVTMISAKFLGSQGGYISDAVLAADYLTALKKGKGLNIVASSNSWGGGGFSQSMLDAINRGGDAGILFVAAAGNGGSDGVGDNNDSTTNYPSNYQCTVRFDTKAARPYDCVVAVAAITSSGSRSTFSNYGAKTVDLGAPGSGITSTLPGNTYGSYSGTSMATPHVSGAIALCAAANPAFTAEQLRQTVLATAYATSSLYGMTVTGGRLDAGAAAAACDRGTVPAMPAAQLPSPPGAFSKSSPVNGATGRSTNQTVSWQTASGATSYELCADTSNDNACGGTWTSVGTATSATVRATSKVTVYWQVRALNAGGTIYANTTTSPDPNSGVWWRYTVK